MRWKTASNDAGETLDNIEGAWVQEMKVSCKNGKIDKYRVNIKVTFILRLKI